MIIEPSIRAVPEVSRRTLAVTAAVFWGGFLALYTLRGALLGTADPGGALVRRVVVVSAAMLLAWLMAFGLTRLGRGRLWPTLVWTAVLSAPAAMLFATINLLVFDVLAPMDAGACGARNACSVANLAPAIVDLAVNRWFVFAAWGVLNLLVRTYAQHRRGAAFELTEADERPEAADVVLDAIWAPTRGGTVKIPITTIRRVEAERDYVRIVSDQGSHLLRIPMARMQARLDAERFVRVHRSMLLRADDIIGLRRVEGAWMALDRSGVLVRVGRRYLDEARRRLGVMG
jgi:two-component system response regulator AlgR